MSRADKGMSKLLEQQIDCEHRNQLCLQQPKSDAVTPTRTSRQGCHPTGMLRDFARDAVSVDPRALKLRSGRVCCTLTLSIKPPVHLSPGRVAVPWPKAPMVVGAADITVSLQKHVCRSVKSRPVRGYSFTIALRHPSLFSIFSTFAVFSLAFWIKGTLTFHQWAHPTARKRVSAHQVTVASTPLPLPRVVLHPSWRSMMPSHMKTLRRRHKALIKKIMSKKEAMALAPMA